MQEKIYSMLGLCMKAGKLAYGTDMCIDKIKYEKAKLVIISEDASQNSKDKFTRLCDENNIMMAVFGKKDEISYKIRQTKQVCFCNNR
jgi:ribosomal protein L7Ae-like RNA K-turn-binding protein